MRNNETTESGTNPAQLSPRALLGIFCSLNLLIYMDRGAIASNGINADGIRVSFGLSLFQVGLLPASFMVGMLIAAPLFAEASKKKAPFRLMAVGLMVWSLSVSGCGLSFGFFSILIFRMMVGVGEASFVALAAPFIDDTAPPQQKTKWLAAFFLCIPVGYALGFIYGGILPQYVGWRLSFIVLSGLMVPFVIFCWHAPPVKLRGAETSASRTPSVTDIAGRYLNNQGSNEENIRGSDYAIEEKVSLIGASRNGDGNANQNVSVQGMIIDDDNDQSGNSSARLAVPAKPFEIKEFFSTMLTDASILWHCKVYLWVTAGATAFTAVMGTYAYWGPSAGRETFGVTSEKADLSFGAITVLTGSLGTLTGGALLDKVGSSLRNALMICSLGLCLGGIGVAVAFSFVQSFSNFCIVFGFAQFAMFMTQAPSSALTLWSVPPGLRPLATSLSMIVIHVFGDVPLPPVAGLLQSKLNNWRITMDLIAILLLIGSICYFLGIRYAHANMDFRQNSNSEGSGENEDFEDV